MKEVIEHLGIKLTSEEFSQVARLFRTDSNWNLDYRGFISMFFPDPKSEDKERWSQTAAKNVREWFIREKLLLKDAFKAMDRDGDGYISEKDLSIFLLNTLRYPSADLTAVRLKDLIDHFDPLKQGRIDVACFGRMINAPNRPGRDWILSLKRDVSSSLARNFPSLEKAFGVLSRNGKKLALADLRKWLKDNVLEDDDELIIDVLVDIDRPAKGYLWEDEFKNSFSLASWKSPLAADLVRALERRFETPRMAYSYVANHTALGYWQLVRAIEELLGKSGRYTKKDYEELWLALAGKDKSIDFERFERMLGNGGQWAYVPPPKGPKDIPVAKYNEEEELAVRVAQSRKLLTEQLQQYSRRGLVDSSIVEEMMAELMAKEGLNFEGQTYSKVIAQTGALGADRRVNLQKMFEGLKARADGSCQFPRDRLKYCC